MFLKGLTTLEGGGSTVGIKQEGLTTLESGEPKVGLKI